MNSLMTTISEGATVDEAHLIPALKGQCAVVDTNVNVNPTPRAARRASDSPTTGSGRAPARAHA